VQVNVAETETEDQAVKRYMRAVLQSGVLNKVCTQLELLADTRQMQGSNQLGWLTSVQQDRLTGHHQQQQQATDRTPTASCGRQAAGAIRPTAQQG
jgi:hypothetical protein